MRDHLAAEHAQRLQRIGAERRPEAEMVGAERYEPLQPRDHVAPIPDDTDPQHLVGHERLGAGQIALGAGSDQFSVTGINTETIVDAGSGADVFTVGTNLTRIEARLLVSGGADGGELLVESDVASNLVVDRLTETRGVITGPDVTGQVEFNEWTGLTITQSDAADSLTVADTTMPLIVNAHGGSDSVTIEYARHQVDVNVGDGDDTVAVAIPAAGLRAGHWRGQHRRSHREDHAARLHVHARSIHPCPRVLREDSVRIS